MTFNIFLQLLFNIIIVASQYALMAYGFILIYRVTKIFHVAHGITFILGAYLISIFTVSSIYILIPLAIISVFLCGGFGVVCELVVYRKLRYNNISTAGYLLASLGIYILFQNLISASFGDDTQSISIAGFRSPIDYFPARITIGQFVSVIITIISLIILTFILYRTRIGRIWRACSINLELAKVSGINTNKTILIVFFIGSVLAGITGILVSMDIDLTPTRGFNVLIMSFIIYVIAGGISTRKIILASLLLTTSQIIGGWYLGTQWQEAIAFLILLVFLLFKPEGFYGKKLRKAEI